MHSICHKHNVNPAVLVTDATKAAQGYAKRAEESLREIREISDDLVRESSLEAGDNVTIARVDEHIVVSADAFDGILDTDLVIGHGAGLDEVTAEWTIVLGDISQEGLIRSSEGHECAVEAAPRSSALELVEAINQSIISDVATASYVDETRILLTAIRPGEQAGKIVFTVSHYNDSRITNPCFGTGTVVCTRDGKDGEPATTHKALLNGHELLSAGNVIAGENVVIKNRNGDLVISATPGGMLELRADMNVNTDSGKVSLAQFCESSSGRIITAAPPLVVTKTDNGYRLSISKTSDITTANTTVGNDITPGVLTVYVPTTDGAKATNALTNADRLPEGVQAIAEGGHVDSISVSKVNSLTDGIEIVDVD